MHNTTKDIIGEGDVENLSSNRGREAFVVVLLARHNPSTLSMVNKGITSWMAGGSQGVTGTSIADWGGNGEGDGGEGGRVGGGGVAEIEEAMSSAVSFFLCFKNPSNKKISCLWRFSGAFCTSREQEIIFQLLNIVRKRETRETREREMNEK